MQRRRRYDTRRGRGPNPGHDLACCVSDVVEFDFNTTLTQPVLPLIMSGLFSTCYQGGGSETGLLINLYIPIQDSNNFNKNFWHGRTLLEAMRYLQ